MSELTTDVLHVDGFAITCRVVGDRITIEVEKDGEVASAGIEAPKGAWPPRERIENLAMNVWRAQHNLRRMLKGQPRKDDW